MEQTNENVESFCCSRCTLLKFYKGTELQKTVYVYRKLLKKHENVVDYDRVDIYTLGYIPSLDLVSKSGVNKAYMCQKRSQFKRTIDLTNAMVLKFKNDIRAEFVDRKGKCSSSSSSSSESSCDEEWG